MGKIIYFTGGARSGKSSQAEKYILTRNYKKKLYIATGIPFDEEMKMRVEKHQRRRGTDWITIEGYADLSKEINSYLEDDGVILLDCLTNMVSNMMLENKNYDWDNISINEVEKIEKRISREIILLLDYLEKIPMDTVIVSNELGMGIVPAYPLGRYFRDICGKVNQIVAERAIEAYVVVSGIMMKLK